MADGTTGPKRRRVRRAAGPTTPDPIEMAMVAEASGKAPGGVAAEVLKKQGALIGWEIADRRAAFGLKVLIGLAGLTAALGLALMVWNASRADGLVIEAIDAPPELVAQGFTGKALAAQLQDALTRMQQETRTPETLGSVREAEATPVKIEIANTGISLAELDRLLRGWLGHETAVSGELVDLKSGPDAGALALTVRIGADPGARVVSKARDVAALTQAAAEQVYFRRQPQSYFGWLRQQGRETDRMAAARSLTSRIAPRDRALGLAFLSGNDPNNPARSRLSMAREAVRLDALSTNGWGSLGNLEDQFGNREGAVAAVRRQILINRRAGFSAEGLRRIQIGNEGRLATLLGDQAVSATRMCGSYDVSPCSPAAVVAVVEGGLFSSRVIRDPTGRILPGAMELGSAHATRAAARLIAAAPSVPMAESRIAFYQRNQAATQLALAREDWAAVLAEADKADLLAASFPAWQFPNRPSIWRAYAFARLGRQAEADVLAATLPADCYECLLVRGRVAEAKRDWAGAERWFAEAHRIAPSPAIGEVMRARARLAGGDAVGAIAVAKAAAKAVPGSADALEVWGEALLAKGDARGAAAKLAAAAKITPWWGRANLKWGEALAAAGKTDEARAKWRAAAGMDLTAAERARVTALLR